jgi:D-beta-D-heptose 7-phosphate kinase/D-beta-D-heptose 1-phosphate adenosyltransferase
MGLFPIRTIALSGGFDPLHIGHIRMFKDAFHFRSPDCLLVDVVVLLNSDEWLMRKKGFVFMPYAEREEMIRSCQWVEDVLPADDSDGSVCSTLKILKPDYFGNGGDRTDKNTPEKELCEQLGIKTLWNLGGGKVQSSSELVSKALR